MLERKRDLQSTIFLPIGKVKRLLDTGKFLRSDIRRGKIDTSLMTVLIKTGHVDAVWVIRLLALVRGQKGRP